MTINQTRRQFLQQTAAGAAAVGLAPLVVARPEAKKDAPKVPPHTLTVIDGKPRDRGRIYGQRLKDDVHKFLNREIYGAFKLGEGTKEHSLRYAGACSKAVRSYSPEIHDELEGIAEGSGLKLEEVVLITLHEELHHRGVLPSIDHCTAVAAGPPYTKDGRTYVGQTWDWMQSVFGMSSVTLCKRSEGPSLLAYGFPGMYCGAGLNSAGIALCWTSASHDPSNRNPRVGIPSYVLLHHLLYQPTLKDVAAEAKRTQAGWFTFVMADGKGNLLNVEGSPKELVVEEHQGRLARVLYGSKQMSGGKVHARATTICGHLDKAKGDMSKEKFQEFFSDRQYTLNQGKPTIDMMLFDCTTRTAHVSRGATWGETWRTFTFDSKDG